MQYSRNVNMHHNDSIYAFNIRDIRSYDTFITCIKSQNIEHEIIDNMSEFGRFIIIHNRLVILIDVDNNIFVYTIDEQTMIIYRAKLDRFVDLIVMLFNYYYILGHTTVDYFTFPIAFGLCNLQWKIANSYRDARIARSLLNTRLLCS